MSFRAVYEHVQKIKAVPVEEAEIQAHIGDLIRASGKRVRIIRTTLDEEIVRGFYLSPRNEDTQFYGAPPGTGLIVLARSLEPDWYRYVLVKELMHVFDDPLDSTNSAAELEGLLFGLQNGTPRETRSRHVQSEYDCLWMALALLCPEAIRVDLEQQRQSQTISDAEIATQLRIPERLVPGLFLPNYKDRVSELLDRIDFS